MDIDGLLNGFDIFDVVIPTILPLVTYVVKLFVKPSKREAEAIAKLLTFFVVVIIKLLRRRLDKNHTLREEIEELHQKAHGLKAKLKDGKIALG